MKIGLMLTEETGGKELGLIEFDPSGMLLLHGFQGGVHVNALKAVVSLLEKNVLQEPLYKKYAEILKQQGSLSVDILLKEAESSAEVINNLVPVPQINGVNYRAISVRSSQ